MADLFLIDFGVFMQAAADLLAGLDPYARIGFFSPPWIFYYLLPFGRLSGAVGQFVWYLLGMVYLVVCIAAFTKPSRWRGILIAALAVSPIVWPYALFGNVIGLVGLGLIGLTRWRRSWLAVPLVLLKPQLAALALVVWAARAGWREVMKAAGLVTAINIPLLIWRPNLYRAFVLKTISGEYAASQALHVTATTSWLPLGSTLWLVTSIIVMILLIWVALWMRNERVTLLATIIANPLAGGGEYALLAAAGAAASPIWQTLALFVLPGLALVLDAHMLVVLAALILMIWEFGWSRKQNLITGVEGG